jgi:RNA-directed DNA polymerase
MIEIKTLAIKNIKHLMAVLISNEAEINDLIQNKEKYYYTMYKAKKEKGRVKKDVDGKTIKRELNPSCGRLYEIQDIIKNRILSKIPLPENIKGGVKGYSNIANAQAHKGRKHKFKTDMKKYFPSIGYERVYKMFLDHGFSSKCCTILTHLTTHKHVLPQGTPTSTHIANLIFFPNDKILIAYCKKNNLRYTRFVDDLVFSSPLDFRNKCLDLINVILDDGFKISIKKTLYRAGNLEITGIDTKNNVLDVPDFFKELMNDASFREESTMGRKSYYKNVRK